MRECSICGMKKATQKKTWENDNGDNQIKNKTVSIEKDRLWTPVRKKKNELFFNIRMKDHIVVGLITYAVGRLKWSINTKRTGRIER